MISSLWNTTARSEVAVDMHPSERTRKATLILLSWGPIGCVYLSQKLYIKLIEFADGRNYVSRGSYKSDLDTGNNLIVSFRERNVDHKLS